MISRLALALVAGLLAACGAPTPDPPADPVVVTDVEALVDEVTGFGRHTTGGHAGAVVWVTSLADAGAGSLREAAKPPGPRWIRFRVSGAIRLRSPVMVGSDTTVDGRGARIVISGAGLAIDGVSNVILENLIFDGGTGDAVQIIDAAHDVWIDHCSFARWGDGLIDITRASTDVTVSWCRFEDHDKVMLISADPTHEGDRVIRVTLHHNHFRRTVERHPRLRFGKVHAYNNYCERWSSYGASSTMGGELFSEANIYEAGLWETEAVITRKGRDPEEGYVRSVGDLALGGARIEVREPVRVFDPAQYYPRPAIAPADEQLRESIVRNAGWRDVQLPQVPSSISTAGAPTGAGAPTSSRSTGMP